MANTITAPKAQDKITVQTNPGEVFEFDFPTADALFERVDGNLQINFDDGGQIILENFFVTDEENEALPTFTFQDGTSVNAGEFLTLLDPNFDVSPAAGPTAPGRPEPTDVEYHARAVIYAHDPSEVNRVSTFNAQDAANVTQVTGHGFGDYKEFIQASYVNGKLVFTLTAEGKAYMAANPGLDYLEGIFQIEQGGQNYNILVVVPRDPSYSAEDLHNQATASGYGKAVDENNLIHGEWHQGDHTSDYTDYFIRSTNHSDDVLLNGSTLGADIHTGWMDKGTAQENWGSDTVTINGTVTAVKDHDSMIYTGKGGNDTVTVGAVETFSGAESHIHTGNDSGDSVTVKGHVYATDDGTQGARSLTTIHSETVTIDADNGHGVGLWSNADGVNANSQIQVISTGTTTIDVDAAKATGVRGWANTDDSYSNITIAARDNLLIDVDGTSSASGVTSGSRRESEVAQHGGSSGGESFVRLEAQNNLDIFVDADGMARGAQSLGGNTHLDIYSHSGAVNIDVTSRNSHAYSVTAEGDGITHDTAETKIFAHENLTITATGKGANSGAHGVWGNLGNLVDLESKTGDIKVIASGNTATGMQGRVDATAHDGDVIVNASGTSSAVGAMISGDITGNRVDVDATSQNGGSYGLDTAGASKLNITAQDAAITAKTTSAQATNGTDVRDAIAMKTSDRAEATITADSVIVLATAGDSATRGASDAYGMQTHSGHVDTTRAKIVSDDVTVTADASNSSGDAYGMAVETIKSSRGVIENVIEGTGANDLVVDIEAHADTGNAYGLLAEQMGGTGTSEAQVKNIIKGAANQIVDIEIASDSVSGKAYGLLARGENTENRISAEKGVVDVNATSGSGAVNAVYAEYGAKNSITSQDVKIEASTGDASAKGLTVYDKDSVNEINASGTVDITVKNGNNFVDAIFASEEGKNIVNAADINVYAYSRHQAVGVFGENKGEVNLTARDDLLIQTGKSAEGHDPLYALGIRAYNDGTKVTLNGGASVTINAESHGHAYGIDSDYKANVSVNSGDVLAINTTAKGTGDNNDNNSLKAYGVRAAGGGTVELTGSDIDIISTQERTGGTITADTRGEAYGLLNDYVGTINVNGLDGKQNNINISATGESAYAVMTRDSSDQGGNVTTITGGNQNDTITLSAISNANTMDGSRMGYAAGLVSSSTGDNVIDGGAGYDTLNITAKGMNVTAGITNTEPYWMGMGSSDARNTIKNVENVKVEAESTAKSAYGIYSNAGNAWGASGEHGFTKILLGDDGPDAREVSITAKATGANGGDAFGIYSRNQEDGVDAGYTLIQGSTTKSNNIKIGAESAAGSALGIWSEAADEAYEKGTTITGGSAKDVVEVSGTGKTSAMGVVAGYSMHGQTHGANVINTGTGADQVIIKATSTNSATDPNNVAIGVYAANAGSNKIITKEGIVEVTATANQGDAYAVRAEGWQGYKAENEIIAKNVELVATANGNASGMAASNAKNTIEAVGNADISAISKDANAYGLNADLKGENMVSAQDVSIIAKSNATGAYSAEAMRAENDGSINEVIAAGAVNLKATSGHHAAGVTSRYNGENKLTGNSIDIVAEGAHSFGLLTEYGGKMSFNLTDTDPNASVNITAGTANGGVRAVGINTAGGDTDITSNANLNVLAQGNGTSSSTTNVHGMYLNGGTTIIDIDGKLDVTAKGGNYSNVHGMNMTGSSTTIKADEVNLDVSGASANGIRGYNSNLNVEGGDLNVNVTSTGNTISHGVLADNGSLNVNVKDGDLNIDLNSTRNAYGIAAVGEAADADITAKNINIDINNSGNSTERNVFGVYSEKGGDITLNGDTSMKLSSSSHATNSSIHGILLAGTGGGGSVTVNGGLDIEASFSYVGSDLYGLSTGELSAHNRLIEVNSGDKDVNIRLGYTKQSDGSWEANTRNESAMGIQTHQAGGDGSETTVTRINAGSGNVNIDVAGGNSHLIYNAKDVVGIKTFGRNALTDIAAKELNINAEGFAANMYGILSQKGGVTDVDVSSLEITLNNKHNSGNSAAIDAWHTGAKNLIDASNVNIDVYANGFATGMNAKGYQETDGKVENTITADNVNIDVYSGSKNAYGMHASNITTTNMETVNTIQAANAAIVVTITAGKGSLGTSWDAYAMLASGEGAKNQILGGDGDDYISLNGRVLAQSGGENLISTGKGDDTIVLNGKIDTGSLTIDAGEGGYDTLVLTANSVAEFQDNYGAWLADLKANNGIDSMDIEAINIKIDDSISQTELDGLQSWLEGYFGTGVDYSVDVTYKEDLGIGDILNFGEHDDILTLEGDFKDAAGLNGGDGMDTLNLDGATYNGSSDFDLSKLAGIADSFEIIDLRGGTENIFTVDSMLDNLADEKLSLAGITNSTAGLAEKLTDVNATALRVHGDDNDTVHLDKSAGWDSSNKAGEVTYDGFTYDVYQNDTDQQQSLLVQQIIQVTDS